MFPASLAAVLKRITSHPQTGKAGILDIVRLSCYECEAFKTTTTFHSLARKVLSGSCSYLMEYRFMNKTDIKSYGLYDKDICHLPFEKRTNRGSVVWNPAKMYQLGPIMRLSKAKQKAKQEAKEAKVQLKLVKLEATSRRRLALLSRHLDKSDIDMKDLGPYLQQAVDRWVQGSKTPVKEFIKWLLDNREDVDRKEGISA